ncbi:YhcN/YlaJ family sporulation lipoprotein [Lentibacillus saliphilus]|uniref:YhcN/YlaJ family sporulation lipoprotein n=1 Tax=Lentibacillus saliphilus TaxID=2737028 RepID=UPI001FEA508B|nr:YhcN/YlaJ family sporulation lipoprotein [Lentibacillus saliphilus]
MKKWTIKSMMLAVVLVLFAACQNVDDNDMEQGMLNDRDNNNNVERTRYQNNDQNNMMDRNRQYDGQQNRNNDNNRQLSRDRNNNNDNRYEVSDEAAKRITDQVKGIDSAYVLTTNNNAYVAAMLNDGQKNNGKRGNDLTNDVKDKISKIVKDVDKDIDNVYVSTNPDFVDLTNNYVNDMNNGEPVEGFFDQMGNMIKRLFPQNR